MRIVSCEQGAPEWLQARLGIPTASSFSKVVTSQGAASRQASGYANELIAEWLCGQPLESFKSDWMNRGNMIEPGARTCYEMLEDCDVEQVGFVVRDDGKAGCSPDGLVGNDGMLQIKCPAPHTHVDYLLKQKIPTDYIVQMQGEMYIAEREWSDFFSFHPIMPPVRLRLHRDEKLIAALIRELANLDETIEQRKAELTAKNITPLEQAA